MASRWLATPLALAAMAAATGLATGTTGTASAATAPAMCPTGFTPASGGLCVKSVPPGPCRGMRLPSGLCPDRKLVKPVCGSPGAAAMVVSQQPGYLNNYPPLTLFPYSMPSRPVPGPLYTCKMQTFAYPPDFKPMTCPSGTTHQRYNSTQPMWRQCVIDGATPPPCASGTYDTASRMCRSTVPKSCPSGYRYDARRNNCTDGAIAQ